MSMKDFYDVGHARQVRQGESSDLFLHLVYYDRRITEFRLDEHKGDLTARVELKDLLSR